MLFVENCFKTGLYLFVPPSRQCQSKQLTLTQSDCESSTRPASPQATMTNLFSIRKKRLGREKHVDPTQPVAGATGQKTLLLLLKADRANILTHVLGFLDVPTLVDLSHLNAQWHGICSHAVHLQCPIAGDHQLLQPFKPFDSRAELIRAVKLYCGHDPVEEISAKLCATNNASKTVSRRDQANAIDKTKKAVLAVTYGHPINRWDVSKVDNFSYVFWGQTSFNEPIGCWDVSGATSLAGMFYGAGSFNQDISLWDVSQVTDTGYTFCQATSFDQDISMWKMDKVKNMTSMFQEATSFNQPISAWDTSNVTNMNWMFADAKSFNSDISTWNMSQVAPRKNMLKGATQFKFSSALRKVGPTPSETTKAVLRTSRAKREIHRMHKSSLGNATFEINHRVFRQNLNKAMTDFCHEKGLSTANLFLLMQELGKDTTIKQDRLFWFTTQPSLGLAALSRAALKMTTAFRQDKFCNYFQMSASRIWIEAFGHRPNKKLLNKVLRSVILQACKTGRVYKAPSQEGFHQALHNVPQQVFWGYVVSAAKNVIQSGGVLDLGEELFVQMNNCPSLDHDDARRDTRWAIHVVHTYLKLVKRKSLGCH